MQILKSNKTNKYYAAHWLGNKWTDTPEYAKKFFGDRINKYKDFLNARGLEAEVIEISNYECYGE